MRCGLTVRRVIRLGYYVVILLLRLWSLGLTVFSILVGNCCFSSVWKVWLLLHGPVRCGGLRTKFTADSATCVRVFATDV